MLGFQTERFKFTSYPGERMMAFFADSNRQILLNQVQSKTIGDGGYWDEHVEKSREYILRTAEGLSGNALVLGLGNGIEVPIEELVQQFRRVTVIDLDDIATASRLARLSVADQRKIVLLQEDLSGIADDLAKNAESQMASSESTLRETARGFVDRIYGVVSSPPDLGERFDFICSSLVLTQLLSLPMEYFSRMAERRFGAEIGTTARLLGGDSETQQFMNKLHIQTQYAHIRFLLDHLTKDGKVYLSCTFKKGIVGRDPFTQEVGLVSELMTLSSPLIVNTAMEPDGNAKQLENWVWYRNPPPRALLWLTKGDAFVVEAFCLSRK